MTYPDGRVINYDYGRGDDAAIDEVMSRLSAIYDDANDNSDIDTGEDVYASYRYLGAGRIVTEDYEDIGVDLDYTGTSNNFSSLDRFGRVVDQVWQDSSDILDEFTYGYDRVGNRIWKENVGAAEIPGTPVHLDELYAYDGLYRFTGVERGNLVDGQYAKEIDGTPGFTQDWDLLDSLGNWADFDDNGTSQTREVNEANEITEIDSSSDDVDHDAAGNMIKVPKLDDSGEHFVLKYDAWNRLVEVYDDGGSTLIAQYQYDGTGRRIVKGIDEGTDGSLDTFTHYFHSRANQVIETRQGDDVSGAAPAAETLEPKHQNIWSPRYVDSLILRDDHDAQGDIITANRLYYLSDANYNVTALVDANGDVAERYLYTPYGTVTVLDPDFTPDADGKSDYDNATLYTGREFDLETELMYYRARYYHSELGRFVSRDPIGYAAGDPSLYRYVLNAPVSSADPFGLSPAQTAVPLPPSVLKLLLLPYQRAVQNALSDVKDNIVIDGITKMVLQAFAEGNTNSGSFEMPNDHTISDAFGLDLTSIENALDDIAKKNAASFKITYKFEGTVSWHLQKIRGCKDRLHWLYTLRTIITVTPNAPPSRPVTYSDVLLTHGGTVLLH